MNGWSRRPHDNASTGSPIAARRLQQDFYYDFSENVLSKLRL